MHMYDIGRHPGAVWRKCDLQCHSPRDRGWSPAEPAVPSDDASRAAWADEFVRAAQSKGLTIVAVTDHHDIAMLSHVLAAAERLPGAGLSVLAGIEITCKDPVQCLALFDPSASVDHWSRLLAKLNNVQPSDHADPKSAPVQHCGLEIDELFMVVADDSLLRERILLIPHFGPPASHKSLNVVGEHARAKALPCEGFYAECPKGELDEGTLNKIRGNATEWGDRRRAIVLTGDNKRQDFERMGAHPTWMRLGETTVEGIRQAFLADEARITFDEPGQPAERIVEMTVLSTLNGPEPIALVFNEGFNAIIGGRGSGKSSMLEYLRFGLARAEGDIPAEGNDQRQKRVRERELVDDTLADGWVRVLLERGGVREEWHREGRTRERVVVTVANGHAETLTVPEAQRRFPARAFHQKELSTTMVVKEAAADNITGIAAAEEIELRRRIDQDIQTAKRTVTTALQDVAALWQAELQLAQAKSAKEDVERRLAAVVTRLAEVGVQESDLAILADEQRYGRARDYLQEVGRTIAEDRVKLETTFAGLLAVDTSRFGTALTFPELDALAHGTTEAKTAATLALCEGLAALDGLASLLDAAKAAFDAKATAFDENCAAAKARQAAHGALLAEREKLGEQLRSASTYEDASMAAVTTKAAASGRLEDASDVLSKLSRGRRDLLSRAAASVQERSEGSLKARWQKDKVRAEHVAALCALLEGSRVRDPELNCSEWVGRMFKGAEPTWGATCAAIVSVYRAKIMAGGTAEPGADAIAAIKREFFAGGEPPRSLTDAQVARIYLNLTDQSVGLLLSATAKDTIALTYVSGGRDIDFAKASPGQQASALLRLLLRQTAGTLIIDQPEDDLDNSVLMDIVELVRRSKTSRQLIFTTHNPNLVVNGDADKVVTMVATAAEDHAPSDAARIGIESDGAIETPVVRQTITRIMEGGLKAFDLRARKYGTDQNG